VYALDATRCVILHLAATQSLRHALGPALAPPRGKCGGAVLALVLVLSQARARGAGSLRPLPPARLGLLLAF
jgi:hypothetical protein